MSMPTTTTRPAPTRAAHTTPIGTGALHQALEDARDLSRLHDFCRAHVCTSDEVSADGKRLDMLKVFALMRARGYQVSEPKHAQQQRRPGFTAWLVDITVPSRHVVQLAFFTPNPPQQHPHNSTHPHRKAS